MSFYIKITNPNAEDIELGSQNATEGQDTSNVTECDIQFDTIDDNVREKKSATVVRMMIQGKIKIDTMGNVKKLFDWSREAANDKLYRKVTIDVYMESKEARHYEFENMFVVDYEEDIVIKDGEESHFVIKLNQRENSMNTIKSASLV